MAASKGHTGVVAALIAARADIINDKENNGLTALHCAAYSRHADIVEELIVAGADVNAKGPYGKTALDFAIENDNLKVIFHNKVQGIAPGQSAAFYEDNDLVAGGFIMKT